VTSGGDMGGAPGSVLVTGFTPDLDSDPTQKPQRNPDCADATGKTASQLSRRGGHGHQKVMIGRGHLRAVPGPIAGTRRAFLARSPIRAYAAGHHQKLT